MLRLINVSKTFVVKGVSTVVARNITLDIPAGKSVALLGRNGAGKSNLLSMIAGTIQPDSGEIQITGTVSWPVGFAGSFHKDLTGAQNTRFVARVYGVDTQDLIDFTHDFSELGHHFYQPVRTYSSGMRSRLAFALSMGIRFDLYLVDEITAVGDASFREKSEAVFMDRMQTSGAIFVSHTMSSVRRVCEAGIVLENGDLTYFDDINHAITKHYENMKKRSDRAAEPTDILQD